MFSPGVVRQGRYNLPAGGIRKPVLSRRSNLSKEERALGAMKRTMELNSLSVRSSGLFYNLAMPANLLINILGWTGSILYLLAYALVSAKKTEGDSLLYQGINILAGILLVIYTLSLQAYATTGLNAVWVAIGAFTLGRKWLTRS